jgi:hypothetical protein
MIKLKCRCGKSEMTVTYTSDRKIRLNVPCLICPSSHNYVISSNTFFEKDTFTLTCNFTGIDVCFIGTPDGVSAALRKSEAEITRMLKDAGIDDFDTLKKNTESEHTSLLLNDPQIEDIVRFMLVELEEEGKIFCECEDKRDCMYDFEFDEDSIIIYCMSCGSSLKIPIENVSNANDFLHCDEIVLKKAKR